MVQRANALFGALGAFWLLAALAVAIGGLYAADWLRNALLIVAAFFLVIAASYFHLSGKENQA